MVLIYIESRNKRKAIVTGYIEPRMIYDNHCQQKQPSIDVLGIGILKICSTFTGEHHAKVWFQ